MTRVVAEVTRGAERAAICERVLRALPQWFGIEDATREYIDAASDLETFAVEDDGELVGFLSLKRHTPRSAEIYVMGVLPERHRAGAGRALVAAAEDRLRGDGVEYLQVKTLGPSRESEGYARTRAFYEACGFEPLEEIHGLWADNPCLLMVKHLGRDARAELRLWNLLKGAMATQALRVAAELRVADAVAAGPRPVAEIAAESGADADSLHRFLRALATEGVFVEGERGVFRNTAASELLRTDGEERWHEFALQFGEEWYDAFALAPHAARTGEPTFPLVYGAAFDEWLQGDAERLARFGRSMESGAAERAGRIADLRWRDGELVVDVGGGTGASLAELLERRPELRGIVFDLPAVAAVAAERVAARGLADRCDVVGGSFYDGVPSGDVYVLSRILHGCSDEAAATVLRNVRAGARPGARVLVLDAVLPEGNEPHGNKWLDLLMLVLSGGRERTADEWRRLLERAGMRIDALDDGLIEATCL